MTGSRAVSADPATVHWRYEKRDWSGHASGGDLRVASSELLAERPRPTAASSAVPIDHEAVRVAKPVLTEIILTLHSSEVVEARGVVLGWRLLTRGSSPLYAPNKPSTGGLDRLRYSATVVLVTLQPNAWPAVSEPAG